MIKVFKAGLMIYGSDNQLGEERYLIEENGLIIGIEKDVNLLAGYGEYELMDYSKFVLMPGLINSHTHLSVTPGEGNQLGQMGRKAEVNILKSIPNLSKELSSGVTTSRIMCEENFIDFYLRDAIEEGLIQGPRLLVSGKAITSVNGHGYVDTSSDGVEEVILNSNKNLEMGADFIKIFVGGGISSNTASLDHSTYSLEEIEAAVNTAKKAGKYVAAHVHGGLGIDLCIEAGVKCIEHASMVNEKQLEQIIDEDMWITGTFSILFHEEGIEKTDMKKDPEIREKVIIGRKIVEETFDRIIHSKAKVSLGTDSMHGLMYYEAQKYVEFGASNQQAVDAITKNAALSCEIEDKLGTLEIGKIADFIVLKGNPLEDIAQLKNVVSVYKSGIEQMIIRDYQ